MSASKVKESVSTSKLTKKEQSLFEEDDDFEEFPAEGNSCLLLLSLTYCLDLCSNYGYNLIKGTLSNKYNYYCSVLKNNEKNNYFLI